MNVWKVLPALFLLAAATSAQAGPLVNGGFEDGTVNGWTTGQGDRTSTPNSALTPASVLPGGSLYDGPSTHSSIITAGTIDPIVGAALGSTVYSGNYSYRVEDTITGGYASVLSQSVQNYTDANIFFAWKAVLEGAHGTDEAAALIIQLRDDTTGQLIINRTYTATAGGGGVDNRFSSQNDYFYTPNWQIEQLAIDAALSGHNFTVSLLAADCEFGGHLGYAYIDGFGGQIPGNDGEVPEPASAALLMLGAGGLLAARRRRKG